MLVLKFIILLILIITGLFISGIGISIYSEIVTFIGIILTFISFMILMLMCIEYSGKEK
jgi:hypothetical protein